MAARIGLIMFSSFLTVQTLVREGQVIRETKDNQIAELKKLCEQSAESLNNDWEKKVSYKRWKSDGEIERLTLWRNPLSYKIMVSTKRKEEFEKNNSVLDYLEIAVVFWYTFSGSLMVYKLVFI